MNRSIKSKRSAFTLVEMVMSTVISVLAIGLMFKVSLQATRVATNVDQQSGNLNKSRTAMDRLTSDIEGADCILVGYPLVSPKYFTKSRDCIILRIPRYDENNPTAVVTTYDVVIYKVDEKETVGATQNTAKGYELKRYTAAITNGVPGAVTLDRSIAFNVCNLQFEYLANENFTANGWQTDWGLRGMPENDTATIKKSIYIRGVDWYTQGFGQFVDGHITFQRAPNWGLPIDVTYPVDPELTVNPSGANAANSVHVTLKVLNTTRSAKNEEKKRVVEFQTRAELRNE